MFVVRRKADGFFVRRNRTAWQKDFWTEDLNKARIYNQPGHAVQSVRHGDECYDKIQKEYKRFDQNTGVLLRIDHYPEWKFNRQKWDSLYEIIRVGTLNLER